MNLLRDGSSMSIQFSRKLVRNLFAVDWHLIEVGGFTIYIAKLILFDHSGNYKYLGPSKLHSDVDTVDNICLLLQYTI